jgi:deazaflavin-dependent oxidoreductase (nitroreductase family)
VARSAWRRRLWLGPIRSIVDVGRGDGRNDAQRGNRNAAVGHLVAVGRDRGHARRASIAAVLNDELGEQLAGWGVVVTVETRGRVTGRPVEVALGYLEESDGSVLVAAGTAESAWVRNLANDPACRVRLGEASWPAVAEPLDGPDAARAVRDLILKYGTPAERLGRGPVFRLRRAAGAT